MSDYCIETVARTWKLRVRFLLVWCSYQIKTRLVGLQWLANAKYYIDSNYILIFNSEYSANAIEWFESMMSQLVLYILFCHVFDLVDLPRSSCPGETNDRDEQQWRIVKQLSPLTRFRERTKTEKEKFHFDGGLRTNGFW